MPLYAFTVRDEDDGTTTTSKRLWPTLAEASDALADYIGRVFTDAGVPAPAITFDAGGRIVENAVRGVAVEFLSADIIRYETEGE